MRIRHALSILVVLLAGSPLAESADGALAPTAFVHHPDCLLHDTGSGHPERPERLVAIVRRVEESPLGDALLRITPGPAAERWLRTVHEPAYLELLARTEAGPPARLDPDTVVSPASWRAARLASGGVLAAIDAVVEGRARNAFVAARPPGHHALADRAMGFCLVNHVAVGARYAQQRHGLERVLIVDWDVHHGNATQATFYADPTVLYFSTHQAPHYPGTGAASEAGTGEGEGLTVNVPLPAGAGDEEVVSAFRERLVPAADAFRPDLVLVSAGFDAHRDDPLAGLALTAAGYGELTRIVVGIADRHAGGRLVSLLEGGYELEALAASVLEHLGALAERRASLAQP